MQNYYIFNKKFKYFCYAMADNNPHNQSVISHNRSRRNISTSWSRTRVGAFKRHSTDFDFLEYLTSV